MRCNRSWSDCDASAASSRVSPVQVRGGPDGSRAQHPWTSGPRAHRGMSCLDARRARLPGASQGCLGDDRTRAGHATGRGHRGPPLDAGGNEEDARGGSRHVRRNVLPVRGRCRRAELGRRAALLGEVRDLDIQLGRFDDWTEEMPGDHREALDELADLLAGHRMQSRRALLEASGSTCADQRLVSGLVAMLEQGPSSGSSACCMPR